jgi:predicted PurR-regulated permease PerM
MRRARSESDRSELHARWLIAALGAVVLFALLPFLSGFVGAAVLAVVIKPAHDRLAPRCGKRVAAALATAGAVVLLLVPGGLLTMLLISETPAALRDIAESTLFQRLSALKVGDVDIGAFAAPIGNTLLSWGSRQAVALIGGATQAALNVAIALFGLYYLLVSDNHAWDMARRILPFSARTADFLANRFRTTTESMLIGIGLTALAQGSIVGGAFALVGLPSAAFWGFVTACVSILPVLGSSLVWLPGTLVLVIDHRYGAAVVLGAVGLIVASNVDNIIRPIIYRRISQIHPMVTLVGAFAGMRLFGLAGLLLGPLLISYLLELQKAYAMEYATPSGVAASAMPISVQGAD